MKTLFYSITLIGFLLPTVADAQNHAAEQKLAKAGYLLSVESVRLNAIGEDISEIRGKNWVLNELDDPKLCDVNMLVENIFWAETICLYESLLLKALEGMAAHKRLEQYSLHYARLKKDTLKRLYRNFKHTQSNFARIDDQEILALSDTVKKEMLRVLSLIEEVISILQDEMRATP